LEAPLQLGLISPDELSEIWGSIPDFENVPAYVAGYVDKREFEERLEKDRVLVADGRLGGRKTLKLTVNKYLGYWHPGDEEYRRRVFEAYLKTKGALQPPAGLPEVEFEGIGEFTKTLHFIASSGVLKRKQEDWEKIVQEL